MGEKEKALLICDINPEMEKGKPNAESMLYAFSIVAYIPVFEEMKNIIFSDLWNNGILKTLMGGGINGCYGIQ